MTMALAGRKRPSPSNSHNHDGSTMARPGARRCGFPECAKTAKPGGFCISHGGGKKCSVDGCSTSVVSRGFCVAHGGGKRCQREACTKSAQTGGFCWIHGGGKKCGFQGCVKRAQSGGACISHGGGKRCRIDNCNKVVQYDGLCVGHGGYRKCLSINCSKKALANSYCQSHGGNSQCSMDGCIRKAVKGGLCSDHKGSSSVITPVQNNPSAVSAYPGTVRHCIEPSKDKQQPSYAFTSSGAYRQQQLQSHRPQHNTSPPGKSLSSWQLKPQRSLEGLPEYSFAKDRPSLHMEPHHSHQGYDDHGIVGSGWSSFGTSLAMLPAIRTYSPLPTLGDLQSRPSLHLGKRKSSPISVTSANGSPQPIKRLASLANIAKLSRPLTPLVGTAGAAGLSPPLVTRHRLRPSPSNFTHDVKASSNTGSWLTRPCQVGNCEHFTETNNLCLLHHSSTQAFQTSSSLGGHGVRGGSSS